MLRARVSNDCNAVGLTSILNRRHFCLAARSRERWRRFRSTFFTLACDILLQSSLSVSRCQTDPPVKYAGNSIIFLVCSFHESNYSVINASVLRQHGWNACWPRSPPVLPMASHLGRTLTLRWHKKPCVESAAAIELTTGQTSRQTDRQTSDRCFTFSAVDAASVTILRPTAH